MKIRLTVSLLLVALIAACATVGVLVVQQRQADRRQALALVSDDGGISGGNFARLLDGGKSWRSYLQALAAFRRAIATPTKPVARKSDADMAAEQAIEVALNAQPTVSLRSQLLNLKAILLVTDAKNDTSSPEADNPLAAPPGNGGDQAASRAHKDAAAALQQAVGLDQSDNDAKFNLELLMKTAPQSTKDDHSQSRSKPSRKQQSQPSGDSKSRRRGGLTRLGSGY